MTDYTIHNPQGAMIIWNYRDRLSSDKSPSNTSTLSNVFIPTLSVLSMTTSKGKGGPSGGFEVRLAPTFNWVSRITVGSWCVLLMSANTEIEDLEYVGKVDERTFRMLGRIESVRMQTVVDETGTRHQEFIVTGVDWADVFNSTLYIDPIATNDTLQAIGNLGMAQRLLYDPKSYTPGNAVPSSTSIVSDVLQLWGSPIPGKSEAAKTNAGIATTSEAQYTLPNEVAQYMGFSSSSASNSFADLVNIQAGPLANRYDTYDNSHVESRGVIEPKALLGTNSLWSLLTKFSNPVLNELIADVRFEGGDAQNDGYSMSYSPQYSKPKLTLYKRIRPFTIRPTLEGDEQNANPMSLDGVNGNVSYFKNVRKVLIPLNNVISIDAGTDWKAKRNFIEVSPRILGFQDSFKNVLKESMQTLDPAAYQREGFRPLIETATMAPMSKTQEGNIFRPVTNWKYILRDWHFNSHLYLNGTVSFAGIDRYIQVGDNICIDSRVLGLEQNNNDKQLSERVDTNVSEPSSKFFMAHVESVSHSMASSNGGSRNFITTVSFVRGILVNQAGDLIDGKLHGMLDDDSAKLTNTEDRLDVSNVKTQLGLDPYPYLKDK